MHQPPGCASRLFRLVRDGAALLAATAVLAAAMWIVVPAPVLPVLAAGVVAPEIAPWLLVVAIAVGLACAALAARRARAVALALCGAAALCALAPIAALPVVLARARAAEPPVPGTRTDPPFSLAQALAPFAAAPSAGVAVTHGVAFRTRDGATLELDLYRPRGAGARPAIVTIYGGAWIFGSRADAAEIGRTYAARGYTVVVPDYRKAPAHRYPAAPNDVEDALAAVAAHAAAWGVDPGRVALFGRSAGAELALLAAYRRGPLAIRAAIGYYAPTDLAEGWRDPPVPDPANVRSILETYVGARPDAAPAAYRAASPLAEVRPGLPPTLLVIGERDALVRPRFHRELAAALRAAGDAVVELELPFANHAFDSVPQGLDGAVARAVTERFLARVMPVAAR